MEEIAPERVVGISISRSPDLARLGYGEEHMHELMIAIARTILRLGAPGMPVHLAYGGDLRQGGFTETLLDLTRAESVITRNKTPGPRQNQHGRIFSYLAWPYYADLSKSYEAQHLNVCSFIRVTPGDAGFDDHVYPETVAESELPADESTFLKARCISRLRALMNNGGGKTFGDDSPPLAARVILGGKTNDYSGVMPGIFEEFLLAQEAGIPIYIVGGFGGAAQTLTNAALDSSETLPAVCTLDGQLAAENNQALQDLVSIYRDKQSESDLKQRYARLQEMMLRYHADLDRPGQELCTNGLSRAENETLMHSCNIVEITGLIACGLRNRWPDATPASFSVR